MKKGLSLIVLVITIIVIIILASAVILSLANNNPIAQATEATFKSNTQAYNSELNMVLASKYASDFTFNPNTFNASPWNGIDPVSGTVKEYITSMTAEEGKNYAINCGKLVYVGTDATQRSWSGSIGLSSQYANNGLILWLDGTDFKNSPQSSKWIDRSGNNNNATPVNIGYTATSGNNGNNAVAFDGVNDYMVVNYNFPATLTIETWANTNNMNNSMMWSFDGTSYTYGPDIWAGSGLNKLYMNIGDTSANPFNNSTFPSTGQWHHYVVTFDQTNNICKLYVDGSFIGNATYRNPQGPNLYISSSDNIGNYLWTGLIKSVRVYNRVLADNEILQNYNVGR